MQYDGFLKSLQFDRNFSPATIRAYASDMLLFSRFLSSKGKTDVSEINREVITEFIEHCKTKAGGRAASIGLSEATIGRRLAVVSNFLITPARRLRLDSGTS